MKNITRLVTLTILLSSSTLASAWSWNDLWYTPDQQAAKLLKAGKAKQAAEAFENKHWKAIADYRSGNYQAC